MIVDKSKLAEQVDKLEKLIKNLTVTMRVLQEQNSELKRKVNRQGAQLNSIRSKL